MRHRLAAVVGTLLLIAGTLYLARGLKTDFIVADDMSEFEVVVETPAGSSLAQTDAIAGRIEAGLRAIPEVQHVFTNIGVRGGVQSNVTDVSIYVGLQHLSERARSQFDVMQQVRQQLRASPELRASVQQVSLVSGGGFRQTPFNLILRGPDLDRLTGYAETLVRRLAAIPGFVDVDTAQAQRSPELQVLVDRQRAADLGVRMADAASTLRVLVGGEKVGFYRELGEQYDVRLRLAQAFRRDASTLPDVTVPSASGQLVRLGNLARLVPGMSPAQIDRYAQERQITVVSNLYQKPLGEAMQQALGIVAELGLPPGYQAVQLGQAKLMAEAFRNFLAAFLLALAFIYMALAAQFESFVHPITIMVSMFLAIPFGLLALVLSGMTLNIYAIMGMFLLIGVVKKNAILQVDYTNVLRGRGLSRFEAQLEADRARLRPILMTTFAIVFGMLPVALGRGDGSASRAALAIAVVGGQALCLVVTLVITPVVYSFFDDLRGWPRRLLALAAGGAAARGPRAAPRGGAERPSARHDDAKPARGARRAGRARSSDSAPARPSGAQPVPPPPARPKPPGRPPPPARPRRPRARRARAAGAAAPSRLAGRRAAPRRPGPAGGGRGDPRRARPRGRALPGAGRGGRPRARLRGVLDRTPGQARRPGPAPHDPPAPPAGPGARRARRGAAGRRARLGLDDRRDERAARARRAVDAALRLGARARGRAARAGRLAPLRLPAVGRPRGGAGRPGRSLVEAPGVDAPGRDLDHDRVPVAQRRLGRGTAGTSRRGAAGSGGTSGSARAPWRCPAPRRRGDRSQPSRVVVGAHGDLRVRAEILDLPPGLAGREVEPPPLHDQAHRDDVRDARGLGGRHVGDPLEREELGVGAAEPHRPGLGR